MYLCQDCGAEFSDEVYPECLDCGCPVCGSHDLDEEVPAEPSKHWKQRDVASGEISKHWKIGLCWDCEHGRRGLCGLWKMTRPCALKSCREFVPND